MPAEPSGPTLAALVQAHKGPHEGYDHARRHDPLYYDSLSQCWIVTGHSPARTILDDHRFSSQLQLERPRIPTRSKAAFVQAAIQRQVLFSDGEEHMRVQRILLRQTAAKMRELTDFIQALGRRLAREAQARGSLDIVHDFSLPFALETVCMVVGIPLDDPDRLSELADWSETYADVTSGHLHVRLEHISLLGDYFRALVASYEGGDSDALIGALLAENVFGHHEDVIINAMMAFTAGRVTTQKLLSDGLVALMPRWEDWRRVVGRNGTRALRRLTEELLRYVTPTRYLARRAVEDVVMDGRTIAEGQRVILFLEAANRDPEVFMQPHALLHDRHPNPHVAFGHGSHKCPGAGIARLEIQTALLVLFETLAHLRPDPQGQPAWAANPNLGGYTAFPCLC